MPELALCISFITLRAEDQKVAEPWLHGKVERHAFASPSMAEAWPYAGWYFGAWYFWCLAATWSWVYWEWTLAVAEPLNQACLFRRESSQSQPTHTEHRFFC